MKYFTIIVLLTIAFSIKGYSQVKFPIEYRVEKQCMSTPMSLLEDVVFLRSYYARPVNIQFDGSKLNMFYDNGESFTKKNLTQIDKEEEYEDEKLGLEAFYFTDDAAVSDTIMFVVDYNVGYVQFILPTKDSQGEYIGYTSYRQFVKEEDLALK